MEYWQDLAVSTLPDHKKDAEDMMVRKSVYLYALKQHGCVTFNHGGEGFDWRVEIDMPTVSAWHPGDTRAFVKTPVYAKAALDYAAYSAEEALDKFDKLANRSGASQLIDLFAKKEQQLENAFSRTLPTKMLSVDGNAGGEDEIQGWLSWTGYGSAISGDARRYEPSDTYAGLSTARGAVGAGTDETDDRYLVWSPTILDATSADWTETTKTWPNTCLEVIREGITHSECTNEAGKALDLVVVTRQGWRDVKNKLEDQNRLPIGRQEENSLVRAGFKAISYDTVEIAWDPHMPANTAYGITFGDMHLRSMQDSLFDWDTEKDLGTKTFRWSMDFFGQHYTSSPRTCFRVVNAS